MSFTPPLTRPHAPEAPEDQSAARGEISGDTLARLVQAIDPADLEATEFEMRQNTISNRRPLIVRGPVDLSRASIGKAVFLYNCEFRESEQGADDAVVNIVAARLSEFAFFNCKFGTVIATDTVIDGNFAMAYCEGVEVHLPNSVIKGGAHFGNLVLKREDGGGDRLPQLNLLGARVTGNLYLAYAEIDGVLVFENSTIDGVVELERLVIRHAGQLAIHGLRAKIGANLFMQRADITGYVYLKGVRVGGTVQCCGSKIDASSVKNENALAFDNAHCGASVHLDEGFEAKGTVSFEHAHVVGSFYCSDGSFSRQSDDRAALDLSDARIDNVLCLSNVKAMKGDLELDGAHVDSFADDGTAWPKDGAISLDGFTFERFRDAGPKPTLLKWEDRCKWLNLQSLAHRGRKQVDGKQSGDELKLQPWTQTAKALRAMGHNDDAARILEQRETLRFRYQRVTTPTAWLGKWFLRWPLRHTAGHGFQPFRALVILVVLWLLSAAVFAAAFHRGMFIPSPDKLIEGARYKVETAEPPQSYQVFDPLFYAADVILPFIDLQQESYWIPVADADRPDKAPKPRPLDLNTIAQVYACPHLWPCKSVDPATASDPRGPMAFVEWLLDHGFARVWYYIAVFFGAFLITVAATGFAGLFNRQ